MSIEVRNPYTLKMLALPDKFESITVTSDGFFLARQNGDCGFNAFLGRPTIRPDGAAAAYRRELWSSLNVQQQRQVALDWARMGLPLENMI